MVIVNFNGGDFLAATVDSVRRQTIACEIVVVDNDSTDASLERIANVRDITVLRSSKNLGFGAGFNLGASGATTPYVATLNPDAVAAPSWLERTVDWMEKHRVHLGSCLIGTADGYYFTSGSWNRWRGAAVAHATLPMKSSDWINGCALVISRPVFERLGGFDERYFLYCEDVDFSLRAKSIGAKLGVFGERLVEHELPGRSAVSLGARKMSIAFVARGRLVARHVPLLARPVACFVQALIVPAAWSRNVRSTLRLASAFAHGFRGGSARP